MFGFTFPSIYMLYQIVNASIGMETRSHELEFSSNPSCLQLGWAAVPRNPRGDRCYSPNIGREPSWTRFRETCRGSHLVIVKLISAIGFKGNGTPIHSCEPLCQVVSEAANTGPCSLICSIGYTEPRLILVMKQMCIFLLPLAVSLRASFAGFTWAEFKTSRSLKAGSCPLELYQESFTLWLCITVCLASTTRHFMIHNVIA